MVRPPAETGRLGGNAEGKKGGGAHREGKRTVRGSGRRREGFF